MDEARAVDEWQRASFVAAYAAAHPRLKPMQPAKINPLRMKNKSGSMRITKDNFQDLKLACQASGSQ